MCVLDSPIKASFFDVDGVVYEGVMGLDFIRFLCDKRLLSETTWGRLLQVQRLYERRELNSLQHHEECAKIWSQSVVGKETKRIQLEARLFAQTMVRKVSENSIEAIRGDKRDGCLIVFVSGSPVETVQSLSNLLNAHYSVGTEVTEMGGRYTGELVKPLPVQKGKAVWIKRIAKTFNVDLTKSKAYGNSELDIPMLELVGTPLAINAKGKLEKIAHDRSWVTHYWGARA